MKRGEGTAGGAGSKLTNKQVNKWHDRLLSIVSKSTLCHFKNGYH